jgi:hypothetical protein
MSSRSELRLDWCSHEAAKYACEKWHYSKCLPRFKNVFIGVWEAGCFAGCVVFGNGVCNHLALKYGLTCWEACELTRIALAAHDTPVSRILRIAVSLLKKQSPGMRLIVSFADPSHGHYGGVYQAAGWIYSGCCLFKQEYMWKGRRVSDRVVSQNVKEGKVRRQDLQKAPTRSKHRYLMPLDAEMRQRIAPLAKPYPKRAASIAGDAPGRQPGQGGSTPTAALNLPSSPVRVDGVLAERREMRNRPCPPAPPQGI